MPQFLVGFCYHEPEAFTLRQRGIIEDFESSTGLYVEANTPQGAMEWGEHVASELLKYVNNDFSLRWKDSGYFCWIEENPESSSWKDCLTFFQHVRVGEMPDLEKWERKHTPPGRFEMESAPDTDVRTMELHRVTRLLCPGVDIPDHAPIDQRYQMK